MFSQDLIEIYYGTKTNHLRTIASKTGIALEEMIFFDNQSDNCRDVADIGVTVAYTPDGVTRKVFDAVLAAFPSSSGKIIK